MRLSISVAVLVLAIRSVLRAGVVSVGPFTGDNSENFNSFQGGTGGHAMLDIFDGEATLVKGAAGSVKIEFSSSRGGDLVTPRSGPVFAGQFDVMEWVFHRPIRQFGGYFENNSRFDDVAVEFFDANDDLLGVASATAPHDAQAWTWNGWRFSTPVHRLTTAGNDIDFIQGFVWFDDMEISYVPEGQWLGCGWWVVVIGWGFRKHDQ
ncbi:MAG: hypothetical protein AAGF97_00995 [Planctomycetota bacterium]